MKACPFCAEEIQNDAIKCRYCGEFLNKSTDLNASSTKTAISDLGSELFAIGIIDRLNLYERGCHIQSKEKLPPERGRLLSSSRTKNYDVVAKWEEIASVSFHQTSQFSVNYVTGEKSFRLNFFLKNGTLVPILLTRRGVLWGAEFIYHNWKIKKLLEILSQHTVLTTS